MNRPPLPLLGDFALGQERERQLCWDGPRDAVPRAHARLASDEGSSRFRRHMPLGLLGPRPPVADGAA